jgi:membrane protein DedA with SNARE-associated domain
LLTTTGGFRQVLNTVAAALSAGPPPLPGFLNSLAGPLGTFGVWAIALLVLVEDFGIPVPGETVLIAGAVYAGSGRLNIVEVGVVGFIAAVVGDNIGYAIGRFGGRRVVDRYGKFIFLTGERMDKAERFFNRHGGKIIAIARFIEGLRQANGIIAGIIEMHWLKFVAFNALGAALWVGTWVSVGYFAGQHIETIYNDITRYSLYALIVVIVLLAAYIAYRLRKRHLKKAAAAARSAEEAASAPTATGAGPGGGAGTDGADVDGADVDGAGVNGAEVHGERSAARAADTPGGGSAEVAGANGTAGAAGHTGAAGANGAHAVPSNGEQGPGNGTRPAQPAEARPTEARPQGPTNGTRPA